MIGRIKENIPGRFLSIEYTGIVKDGKEITDGDEVKRWVGGLESYSFKPAATGTLLSVDIDSDQEFKSYFNETWPKALMVLKSLCEKS
jgi:predicted secreted protein